MALLQSMRRGPAAAAALLTAVLLGAWGASAQVATYLSDSDLKRFEAIGKAGIASPATPEDVYYGAKLLEALGQKPAGAGLCAAAEKLVSRGSGSSADAAAVGFGLAALKDGGCAQELGAAGAKAVPVLQKAWKSETFLGKYAALLGALALGGEGTQQVVESVDAAVKQINKYRDEGGLVAGGTEGTFVLLELLAASKVTSKGIKKTLDKAQQLLPGSSADAGGADAALVAALDAALRALGSDASVAALGLGDDQVATLARKLLKMKAAASAKAAYKALAGLQVLAALANPPLAVALATPVVAPKGTFVVEVRTLLGKDAAAAEGVVVESLQAPAKGYDIDAFRDLALTAAGPGRFEGAAGELGPGIYELHLTAGGKTGIKRPLIVRAPGAVTDVEVTVAGQAAGSRLAPGAAATALEGDVVKVMFKLASPAPAQQAFLRFTQLGGPVEVLYAAKRAALDDGAWAYTATVALVHEMERFAHASGDYALTLLVGDVSLEAPLEVALGTLGLRFPAAPKQHFPLYTRPLLWDSDNAVAPLPEIRHEFRQPERRPNPVVPAAFTALVLSGFCFFLLYLPRVGANLEALPKGAAGAWSLAWLGSLAGICCLFTAYWVYLKGFTTLRYLLALSLAAVFFGHQAISKKAATTSAAY